MRPVGQGAPHPHIPSGHPYPHPHPACHGRCADVPHVHAVPYLHAVPHMPRCATHACCTTHALRAQRSRRQLGRDVQPHISPCLACPPSALCSLCCMRVVLDLLHACHARFGAFAPCLLCCMRAVLA